MSLLTAEQLLTAGKKIPFQDVPIAELGGSVRVQALPGLEYEQWESMAYGNDGKPKADARRNFRAKLVAMSCVNEDGSKMFTPEQAAELGLVRADILLKLYEAAAKLNGLRSEDVEDIAKNSESGQSA